MKPVDLPLSSLAMPPPSPAEPLPLDLPRLVMRRASWVALLCLLAAVVLGLLRARYDTGQELDAALRLARTTERLQALGTLDDDRALAALRDMGNLRHLRLELQDADGRLLLRSAEPPPPGPLLGGLLTLSRAMLPEPPPGTVDWPLARPQGRPWTVHFIATPQSEQREALSNLIDLFVLLFACCSLMLAAMHWNVRRAFRPLQPLLQAITRMEHQDLRALRLLPAMPIRELDAIAAALKHLADALQQAESARRVLGHKVLTLQEDERQRIARDLHDEFGQRLTALRVDATWLARHVAKNPELARVVAGMIEQCGHIQQDVRRLLARLRPLGPSVDSDSEPRDTLGRLKNLLEGLATGWSASSPGAPRCSLQWLRGAPESPTLVADDQLDDLVLPRELVLAVYRITQEALTNVARHAQASRALVRVCIETTSALTGTLHWSTEDDGRGIGDATLAFHQGNGLAGIKERVWAAGGELAWGAVRPRAPRGLRLEARIPFEMQPAATA